MMEVREDKIKLTLFINIKVIRFLDKTTFKYDYLINFLQSTGILLVGTQYRPQIIMKELL